VFDLKIATYDSKGIKNEEFDSPNGKNGSEFFTLISTEKGVYNINIYPNDKKQSLRNYELSLTVVKPRATTPNGQVDELFAVWDSDDTPGAAIAVVKDGNIIYSKGYGIANLEYDIPI
jgi:hypothetical protein